MKVAVGLSGGVDSAVAAYLLREQGYEVMGITLLLKPGESDADVSDAIAVARSLGIEHKILDRRDLFREKIINPFADEYVNGRTPNPCIECNQVIKFGAMLDYALENGCDKLATGHYAACEFTDGRYLLKKSDSPKDQSYFLYRLNEFQLSKIIFPVTVKDKEDIRQTAQQAGIPVADKKDSLEICFVPDDNYVGYLASIGITSPAGNIISKDGTVMGKHSGIINYTVGQRKGIGAYGRPMFVTDINASDNTVTIGDNGEQYSSSLTADRVSFIGDVPTEPFRAEVKIRFRAKQVPALVTPFEGGFTVDFDEPQRSVTPGQSAVIYDGDTVLGGGRIISKK